MNQTSEKNKKNVIIEIKIIELMKYSETVNSL